MITGDHVRMTDGASHKLRAGGGVLAASRRGSHPVVFGRMEL
jgi:hypothetical protein